VKDDSKDESYVDNEDKENDMNDEDGKEVEDEKMKGDSEEENDIGDDNEKVKSDTEDKSDVDDEYGNSNESPTNFTEFALNIAHGFEIRSGFIQGIHEMANSNDDPLESLHIKYILCS
jgi:hypothetical protein